MRYLGPLQFKVHAKTETARQAGLLYEPLARTMVSQMLAFSGDVAVNVFRRQLPDGTRLAVYMNREGLAPAFIAQVWPVEGGEADESQETFSEDEPITPYFFAGLQWVEGGELIGDRFGPGTLTGGGSVTLKAELKRRDARVIPHLVVWEPGREGGQDIPVMVKRWTNPPRPPTWGVSFPPSNDTYFMNVGLVNAAIPQDQLFLNHRQNAYWWHNPSLRRWRYHFFARSEAGLTVWEYDNFGRVGLTPHPIEYDRRYLDEFETYPLAPDPERTDLYLAVAEMNPQGRGDGRNYDELSFTSYPAGFSVPFGTPLTAAQKLGSGYGELATNNPEALSPLPPNHVAAVTGGTYLCKVVCESFGPSYNWAPIYAPVTVRLVVDTGLKSNGQPAIRDVYTMTITGSTHARRVLHPGGYYANPDLQPAPVPAPYLQFTDFGPNPAGPAWSSETIAIFPMGGSGLTDQVPWGLNPSLPEPSWTVGFSPDGFPISPDYPYRSHYNIWLDDPKSYG